MRRGSRIPLLFSDSQYERQILTDPSLVGFWPLKETVGVVFHDGKRALDAAIAGGVTLETAFSRGHGATFNGSSGYGSIGDVSKLDIFSRTQPFTFRALIKPNVTKSGGTQWHFIYSKANPSSPTNGLSFGLEYYNNTASLGMTLQFGANYASQFIRLFAEQDLGTGIEYDVAVTYDGSAAATGVKFYVDGNLTPAFDDTIPFYNGVYTGGAASGTIASGQDTTAPGHAAEIGRRGSLGQYFAGGMKDVAIFSEEKSQSWLRRLVAGYAPTKANIEITDPTTLYVPNTTPRPQIIYDHDCDTDVGDCAEAVMLFNLEHQGLLDIAAAIVTSSNSKAAPCSYAIANYYGRSSLPYGANTSNSPGPSTSLFASSIATTYGVAGKTDASNFADATTVLRQTLAAAADNSIDYFTNGDLGSVQLLLQSTADGYSPLDGVDLVAQKIRSLWACGGVWPSGNGLSDFGSTAPCATTTAYVLQHWPTTVPIFLINLSDGNAVRYGASVMEALNASNPARAAWELYFGNSLTTNTRGGWSGIYYLTAVYGFDAGYMTIGGANGTAAIDTTSRNTSWWQNENSNHHWLKKVMSNANFVAAINALIIDAASW